MVGEGGDLRGTSTGLAALVAAELREQTHFLGSGASLLGADAVCMPDQAVGGAAQYLGCWSRVVWEGN